MTPGHVPLGFFLAHPAPWRLANGEVRDAEGKPIHEFDGRRDRASVALWQGIVAAVNATAATLGASLPARSDTPSFAGRRNAPVAAGADGPRPSKARATRSPSQTRSHA